MCVGVLVRLTGMLAYSNGQPPDNHPDSIGCLETVSNFQLLPVNWVELECSYASSREVYTGFSKYQYSHKGKFKANPRFNRISSRLTLGSVTRTKYNPCASDQSVRYG